MSGRTSLSFSVRRHFVDGFFKAHDSLYRDRVNVIDVGGRKHEKRGTFDIGAYPCAVTYVNIEPATEPDIVADAASLPVPDSSFNLVLLGELLEHVPEPIRVIREAYRVLKPDGTLLATVPFMYPVHADPHDYGRYTPQYLRTALEAAGFGEIAIEPQGSWYAMLALLIQSYFRFPRRSRVGRIIGKVVRPFLGFLLVRDRHAGPAEHAWTTGYGITANKRISV